MIEFYGYKKCSTCRKAEKLLQSLDLSYRFIDITEKPPTIAKLKKTLQSYPIAKLFNTSGVIYRKRKMKEKIKTASESDLLKDLASEGKLIKRPFIASNSGFIIGFDEEKISSLR